MTTNPEFDDLMVRACVTRQQHREREEYLAELRDRADESGDSTDYDAARIDALTDCQDDLWALIEHIEKLKVDSIPTAGPTTTPVARRAATARQLHAGSNPAADRTADASNTGDSCNVLDEGDAYSARALTGVLPFAGTSAGVDAGLAALTSGQPIVGARSTVEVRVRRDSHDFRQMFDPCPEQIALISGEGEYEYFVTELAILALLECEEFVARPPFVCVAVRDDVVPDVMHVVSGWVTGIGYGDEGPILEFEDGASVEHEQFVGIRIG